MSGLPPDLALAVAAGAVLALATGTAALARRRRDRAYGRLTYLDPGPGRLAPLLVAPRVGLTGRPDEVRRGRDGASVPVEWKTARAPPRGPHPSHRVQVLAYCLLLEETTGRSPPFGVLRYSDGPEFRVPWDAAARREILGRLADLRRPYDGRADPSPGKCAGCRWATGCDARAV